MDLQFSSSDNELPEAKKPQPQENNEKHAPKKRGRKPKVLNPNLDHSDLSNNEQENYCSLPNVAPKKRGRPKSKKNQ